VLVVDEGIQIELLEIDKFVPTKIGKDEWAALFPKVPLTDIKPFAISSPVEFGLK